MTFFLLSSWRTSKATSRMLGKGLVPNILPRTSSIFLFNPNKKFVGPFLLNDLLVFDCIGWAVPFDGFKHVQLLLTAR